MVAGPKVSWCVDAGRTVSQVHWIAVGNAVDGKLHLPVRANNSVQCTRHTGREGGRLAVHRGSGRTDNAGASGSRGHLQRGLNVGCRVEVLVTRLTGFQHYGSRTVDGQDVAIGNGSRSGNHNVLECKSRTSRADQRDGAVTKADRCERAEGDRLIRTLNLNRDRLAAVEVGQRIAGEGRQDRVSTTGKAA